MGNSLTHIFFRMLRNTQYIYILICTFQRVLTVDVHAAWLVSRAAGCTGAVGEGQVTEGRNSLQFFPTLALQLHTRLVAELERPELFRVLREGVTVRKHRVAGDGPHKEVTFVGEVLPF